ncbi:MAG: ABC transporter permease [Bacilli bacterium]
MLNKFWYLTKVSLKKKMGSKWFIIVNLVLLLAIVGISNADNIINYFGGDFNDTQKIIIIDKSNISYEELKQQLENGKNLVNSDVKIKITRSEDYDKAVKKIKDSKDIIVLIENDESNYIKAKIVSDGFTPPLTYNLLSTALINTKSMIALKNTNISQEDLLKLNTPIKLERVLLDADKTSSEENMNTIMGTIFPTIILPFFMLVLFLVQMIGTEINEEKSTRSMEVIISNVSPKAHFFSKILSSNIFVISQGVLLMIYGGIGFLTRGLFTHTTSSIGNQITDFIGPLFKTLQETGFLDKLVYIIPLTLILLVLSFLAYSLVAGILASMSTNIEDFQQVQSPIIMISLIGYYLAIMAGMFQGSLFIRILSYIPFISSLLSPALLVLGQIGLIDVIISIVILTLFNGILLKYGLKVYKVGILNYSTTKIWKKFFKAIKS